MKWSRSLSGRWMETCYLCKGHIEEEMCSSVERHYACTNQGCAARFQLFFRTSTPTKKYGTFVCLIFAQAGILRGGINTFLEEELCASCPVCEQSFVDRGDGILFCPSGICGVSVEFYLQEFPMFFCSLSVVVRVPEPGFSKMLSRHLDPRFYN